MLNAALSTCVCPHPSSVRKGYLPQQTIQSDIGDIEIKVLKSGITAETEYASTACCYCLI
ncbi:MAG: hypothetical protein ACTS73_04315 [Arsenophonus sp. NEOnobi-MAG3]